MLYLLACKPLSTISIININKAKSLEIIGLKINRIWYWNLKTANDFVNTSILLRKSDVWNTSIGLDVLTI